ncbi:MAG: radical SAM protein, partial [Desulfobacterales bacterium]
MPILQPVLKPLQESYESKNTWAKRALKNRSRNIKALQTAATYQNRDRYKRAVADLNKVMEITGKNAGLQLSLANYQDNTLSPLCIDDLRKAAAGYKENIYYPYFSRHLKDLIAERPPAVIGLSLNFLSQALCAFSIIGYLKATYPTTKIVVGGGLATTWLSHPEWNHPFKGLIDLFIGGRGERPLLKLLGKEDRDTINLPDYTIFPLADYLAPGTIIPYTTSFGCFWKKCNFCPETSENNLYSHTPPATSTYQLQQLREKHSPILFHLLDNALSSSTLRAFTHNKPNIPWYGFARFDKLLANPDFCKRLAQSGCVMLKLGLESGDQNVL